MKSNQSRVLFHALRASELTTNIDRESQGATMHLFTGTHAVNMDDMAKKGRSGAKKLTEDQVREVMRLREEGVPRRKIVEQTGVNVHTMKNIFVGRTWRRITGL